MDCGRDAEKEMATIRWPFGEKCDVREAVRVSTDFERTYAVVLHGKLEDLQNQWRCNASGS